MSMPQSRMSGRSVGRIGYGLMQLTWAAKPLSDEEAFPPMKAAVDAGMTAWSTATFYGNPPHGLANLEMLSRFFQKYPEYKDKITLVVKGGMVKDDLSELSGKLDFLRDDIKKAQTALGDKFIDVYTVSRLPDDVPLEEMFKNLKTLVDEGLIGGVGTSEMKAGSLRKAHTIIPIATIEIEVSLWSFEQNIKDVLAWSRETSVPVFAYSPLGRGFISRQWKTPDDIPEGSFQRYLPRFQGEAFYENIKLVDELDKLAEKKGCTTGQLALAWVVGLSPYNVPIPGSSSVKRVQENAAAANISLSDSELENINNILDNFEVKGTRYPAGGLHMLMK